MGLRARGGCTVGLSWHDGRLRAVRLSLPRGQTVKVRSAVPVRLAEDGPVGARLDTTDEPGLATLVAKVAGIYELEART
jgi:hypothetical protein